MARPYGASRRRRQRQQHPSLKHHPPSPERVFLLLLRMSLLNKHHLLYLFLDDSLGCDNAGSLGALAYYFWRSRVSARPTAPDVAPVKPSEISRRLIIHRGGVSEIQWLLLDFTESLSSAFPQANLKLLNNGLSCRTELVLPCSIDNKSCTPYP